VVQIFKLIFYILRELIFDNKDEADFKSANFNARKFIILIVFCLSVAANLWLMARMVTVAKDLILLRERVEQCQAPQPNITGP
jgi:hypothetical protein